MQQQPKQKFTVLKSALIGTAVAVPVGIGAMYYGFRTGQTEIPTNSNQIIVQSTTPKTETDLKIKGNKSSRIYHLPGCPNYNDIAERNVVWFKTHEDAKARGFRMAKNC